jgi:tetratricopeptide (TPR) repeat protein
MHRGGWCNLLALPFLLICSLAWGDLAGLDKPANSEAMQAQLEVLNRQIRSRPDAAALYVQRGETYFKLREFDKAIEDYNTAIRMDDSQDDAYFGRGMTLGRSGEIDKGIADLDVYIRRHPKSSLAHTKRGVRYLWKGDEANAEKDFIQAIALNPRNAEAHDDLGVIYARRGDYGKAAEHFSATIRIDSTYQKAYHNLAMVYFLTDHESQALTVVNEALQLVPEDRNTLMLKSNILDSLGRAEEARRTREEAEFLPAGNWSERMPVH